MDNQKSGTAPVSFGEHIKLQEGDEMHINFENVGRPLINTLHVDASKEDIQEIKYPDNNT